MRNYEIVRVRKRWEVRADGIIRGTFDSEPEAALAARQLFGTSPSAGYSQIDPRRHTKRIGRRHRTDA